MKTVRYLFAVKRAYSGMARDLKNFQFRAFSVLTQALSGKLLYIAYYILYILHICDPKYVFARKWTELRVFCALYVFSLFFSPLLTFYLPSFAFQ
jgi:hypothetical protein